MPQQSSAEMEALAGALGLATALLSILAVDLLRAHGRIVSSLESLDPLDESNVAPVPLIMNPKPPSSAA